MADYDDGFDGAPQVCSKDLKRYFYLIGAVALVVLFGALIYRQTAGGGLKLGELWSRVNGGHAAPAPVQIGTPVAGGAMAPVNATILTAPPSAAGMVMMPPVVSSGGNEFSSVVNVLRNSVASVTASAIGAAANDPMAAPTIADGQNHFTTPMARSVENIGTGIIVRNDGYILTNFHVVRGADTVTVTVQDDNGSTRNRAEIVKMDETLDLALLKIVPKAPLSPAILGDSSAVRVADEVIAIGSPFGLDMTVSRGIVSARRKSLVIEGVTHTNLIQTDAAINQGNSGGPLVSRTGTVIGVNTAIYTPNGAFAGIGFAVPSNQARTFVLDEVGTLPTSTVDGAQFGLVAFPAQVSPMQPATGFGSAGPAIVAGTPSPHTDGRQNLDCTMCHDVVAGPMQGRTQRSIPAMNVAAQRSAPPIAMGAPSPHNDNRDTMNCASCHQMLPAAGTVAFPMLPIAAPMAPPPIPVGTVSPHTDGRETMNCATCHQMLPAGNASVGAATIAVPGYQFANPPGSLAVNVVRQPGNLSGVPVNRGAGGGVTVQGATLIGQGASGFHLWGSSGRGVSIAAVAPGSAAATAGLQAGDVLLKVDGRPVEAAHDVSTMINGMPAGRPVRLGILRNGDSLGLNMMVGPVALTAAAQMPGSSFATAPGMAAAPPVPTRPAAPMVAAPTEFAWLGMEVETFQAVKLPPGTPAGVQIQGAVVGEVLPGSRADRAALMARDVIIEVNNVPVGNAVNFDAATRVIPASGQAILLKINRAGREFLVVL